MPLTQDQIKKRQQAREAREQKEAALLKKIAGLEESRDELTARLKDAEEKLGLFKDVDLKTVFESIDEIKAYKRTVREGIRRDKGGLYVPGLEDEAHNFNLVKAVAAAASNGAIHGETKEWEAVREATKVARASNTAFEGEGGGFVPDQVIPDVIGALYEDSVMFNLDGTTGRTRVSVITGLSGERARIPKFKSGMMAYWVGQKQKYTKSDPETRVVTMTAKKLGLATDLTEEMIRRANYGYDTLLRNDMRQVASAEVDRVILYGDGTDHEPRGVINHPAVAQYYHETKSTTAPVTTPVGARPNWAQLNLMKLVLEENKVKENSTSAWISSPRFFRDLSNLRTLNFSGQDEDTAPFLASLPPITMNALRDLLGDFDKTTEISAARSIAGSGQGSASAYTDLFYGNWGEVVVGRWGGTEILSDQGLSSDNFHADIVSLKMRMWMDVVLRHDESIVYSRDVRVLPFT